MWIIALATSLLIGVGCSTEHATVTTTSTPTGGALQVTEPDDPRLTWSPYTWVADGEVRYTPTVGAYLEVTFRGDTIGVRIPPDAIEMTDDDQGEIVVSAEIDGGPRRGHTIDPGVDDTITWTGLGPRRHEARITLDVNMFSKTRWSNGSAASLHVTGILTAGPVLAPRQSPGRAPRAIFYGDSLVEGNDIDDLGTVGSNSFAAVAMEDLGYAYGLRGFSGASWQRNYLLPSGTFVDLSTATPGPDITWMNYYHGHSMITGTRPYRYLEGDPDLIVNSLGANDVAIQTSDNPAVPRPTTYLADAVETWLDQVRTVTGPSTVIALVEPFVYQCNYPHLASDAAEIKAVRDAYRAGIAAYQADHPEDRRFFAIRLPDTVCSAILSHDGQPDHPGSLHFAPDTAETVGDLLATELEARLKTL